MLPGWLTIKQAAERYGYHEVHLRRIARSKRVKSKRLGPLVLLNIESLQEYFEDTSDHGSRRKRGPKNH